MINKYYYKLKLKKLIVNNIYIFLITIANKNKDNLIINKVMNINIYFI